MTSTTFAIDGVAPASRISPTTREELAEALHAADEQGQSVAPLGGGTQLELGMPPARLDLAIETGGLNRLVEYEPADLTVTAEAGMRLADLQRLLGEQGQFLALDPPAQQGSTLGGLIATNASGPLRFAFGTPRDVVIGTRVANPDGTLTHAGGRVVKNVAGYDLNKLYIGSLGTLGIVVELSFKVAPIPPATGTVIGQFGNIGAVRDVLEALVRSTLSPLAIELVGPGAAQAAGLPAASLLVLRVGGYPRTVERQLRDLSGLLDQHGGQCVDASDTSWDDLGRMRLDAQQRPVVLKAAAPIAASARLVEVLEQRLRDLAPAVWAHAGSGVAFAACDAPADATVLVDTRAEVARLGGNASLVARRCPTGLKGTFDVWGDPGSSVSLMRALKAKLDPKNTLNPGRYVGGI